MKPKLYICNGAGAKWCPKCARSAIHPELPGCGRHLCRYAIDKKTHWVKCIPVHRKPDPLGRGLAERLFFASGINNYMSYGWEKRFQAVAREVLKIVEEVGK